MSSTLFEWEGQHGRCTPVRVVVETSGGMSVWISVEHPDGNGLRGERRGFSSYIPNDEAEKMAYAILDYLGVGRNDRGNRAGEEREA